MSTIPSFHRFTDAHLIDEMPRLIATECGATAVVVAALAEFDARRLWLPLGRSSLFAYCVQDLKLTEDAACSRIEAARAARKFPAMIRRLPEPKPSAVADVAVPALVIAQPVVRGVPPPPPSRRPVVAPLSEAHYKLQVTISSAARQRLTAIQDLMRHRLPSGDPAAIVEHALEVLHADLLKQKAAQVAKPRQGKQAADAKGRYIPAAVKREVWRRDEGRCAFVVDDGSKCGSGSGVEFHHVQPYAVGGQATAANIELRCRSHNGFEWGRHLDLETAALVGGKDG